MPKASIKFTLPEEEREFRIAINSGDISACLWEIDQYCRNILRHGDPAQELKIHLEHIRKIIFESDALIE
jgi:hypothetical protein